MMIPLGIPDLLCRIRHLEETSAVELRGRAWAGGLRIDSVEVSLDGGRLTRLASPWRLPGYPVPGPPLIAW